MDTEKILKWTIDRISFVRENHSYVKEIHLYNSFETRFGKEYYRIYFDIATNISNYHPTFTYDANGKIKHLDLPESQKTENKIISYVSDNETNNFSFYALHHNEKEVNIHYEWVSSMIWQWLSKRNFENNFTINTDRFETQDLRDDRIMKEREDKKINRLCYIYSIWL